MASCLLTCGLSQCPCHVRLDIKLAAHTFDPFQEAKAQTQKRRPQETFGFVTDGRCEQVTKEFYDEVVCELASLYCRHQPRTPASLLETQRKTKDSRPGLTKDQFLN